MLKDVADSRRIDKHMANRLNVSCYFTHVELTTQTHFFQTPLHPAIISHLFWPNLQTSSLKMPGQFEKQVSRQTLRYLY